MRLKPDILIPSSPMMPDLGTVRIGPIVNTTVSTNLLVLPMLQRRPSTTPCSTPSWVQLTAPVHQRQGLEPKDHASHPQIPFHRLGTPLQQRNGSLHLHWLRSLCLSPFPCLLLHPRILAEQPLFYPTMSSKSLVIPRTGMHWPLGETNLYFRPLDAIVADIVWISRALPKTVDCSPT